METYFLNVAMVKTPPMIPESMPNNMPPKHAWDCQPAALRCRVLLSVPSTLERTHAIHRSPGDPV